MYITNAHIPGMSLCTYMVLLGLYVVSKLSDVFFRKCNVKCNYIALFVACLVVLFYTCMNVKCNVPGSDKHFYRTLLSSILTKFYLSPKFDSL